MHELSAADRLQILDLMARYCQAFDSVDTDGVAGCFTDDGVLAGGPTGDVAGHEAIKEYAARVGGRPTRRHFNLNIVIKPHSSDPDRAAARSYFAYLEIDDGGVHIRLTGRYADELVKVGDRWQLSLRTATIDKPRSDSAG
jgi:ketosteroid isomerase-like protein